MIHLISVLLFAFVKAESIAPQKETSNKIRPIPKHSDIKNKPTGTNDIADELSLELSFSTGVTYLNFQQSFLQQSISNVTFTSFNLPYLDLSFKAQLDKRLSYRMQFIKFIPSQTESNNNSIVEDKILALRSTSGEFSYRLKPFNKSLRWLQVSPLFGFQFQQLPVVHRTDVNRFEAGIFGQTLLSAGVFLEETQWSKKWDHQLTTHLFYPILNNSGAKLTSPILLDLEWGSFYNINKKWKVGAFWFLQYNAYNVSTNHIDGVDGSRLNVEQSNIYSSFFARVLYVW